MNKADTSRIRATCENAPVINQNSSFADACKCSEALTEILELTAIARDAGQEEPERNGDGDTLEDIKAVWGEFGKRSIEFSSDKRTEWAFATGSFNFTLNHYRITAKHADRFDPKCMSLEVWARAAIGRGEIKRERNGCIEIYDTFSNGYLHGRRCMPTSGHKVDYRITFAIHDHSTWTAIPRAEAPAGERESENPEPCALCGKPSTHICHCPQCMDMLELDGDNPDAGRALCDECGNDQCKPIPAKHIHAVISYLQPLWDLMHQEHGLILVETEMHDIMAACKVVEQAEAEAEPKPEANVLLSEAYAIIGETGKDKTYKEQREHWKRASEWCWKYQDRLRDEAPALEEWEACSAREADQFSTRTVFTGGIRSSWQDVPSDMSGEQTGFSDLIKYRRRKPAAEAQGSSTLRDVAVLAANLDTSQTCDPDHHALVVATMDALEHDRPEFDVQAAVRLFNTGYHKGHEDTVEAQYTDILPVDMDSYHEEEVNEIIQAGIGGVKGGTQ